MLAPICVSYKIRQLSEQKYEYHYEGQQIFILATTYKSYFLSCTDNSNIYNY